MPKYEYKEGVKQVGLRIYIGLKFTAFAEFFYFLDIVFQKEVTDLIPFLKVLYHSRKTSTKVESVAEFYTFIVYTSIVFIN